jgi:hypothetical protein
MSVLNSIRSEIKASMEKDMRKINAAIKSREKLLPSAKADDILAEAGEVMLKSIRNNLSSLGLGKYSNMIKIFKGKANYSVTIGIDYKNSEAYKLRWFEYGTVQRFRRNKKTAKTTKKSGSISTGNMIATPFMRPGFELTQKEVYKRAQINMIKYIEENLKP